MTDEALAKMITDSVKIGVLEGLQSHYEKAHDPLKREIGELNEKLSDVKGDIKFFKGVSYGINFLIAGASACALWFSGGKPSQ